MNLKSGDIITLDNGEKVKVTLETSEKWEEPSLTALSKTCPLGLSTLVRLKRGVCGIKITKKYKLTW